MQRRNFIKLVGGTTAGLALTSCATRQTLPVKDPLSEWRAGAEQWIPSTCLQCPGGCGIQARIVDGNVIKLEGNPLHPINNGRLCQVGQAGLQVLYHPDRLRGPMIQTGKKGSGQWQRLSWTEAIKTVGGRLREMRSRNASHSMMLWDGYGSGLMSALFQRFAEVYGSPNYCSYASGDGMAPAYYAEQGLANPVGYDLENANYILSFGCDLLGQWRSPVWAQRVYGYLRQERPGPKAKLVQVEPRLSLTASRADEWIPVHPGAQGALALAIAYVLIREDLYAADYVSQHTFGFDDWTDAAGRRHMGFKSLILKEYRPDDVAGITGVPVDTIIRIAKEFAQHRPALAIGGPGATMFSNGTYTAMAIHALNALVGGIGAPGGYFSQREFPFKPFSPANRDAIAQKGCSMPRLGDDESHPLISQGRPDLSEALLTETPYPAEVLFLYYANPLFSTLQPEKLTKAFEKIPLVVSFSPFMDESAQHADIILPDHTYLERWQDVPAAPTSGAIVLGMAQPVIKPLYDTLHTGDALMLIGREIGGSVKEAFPWQDFKSLLVESVQGVFEAKRGSVFTESFEAENVRQLAKRGWWIPTHSSFDDFWNDLLKKGGWWEPQDSFDEWGKTFQTPSGKFEFYSQLLAAKLAGLTPTVGAGAPGRRIDAMKPLPAEMGGGADSDKMVLPHYEAPKSSVAKDGSTFYLNVFRPEVLVGGGAAIPPWLQEIIGPHVFMKWDSWVEINPATAQKLEINDGDWIWVESSKGRFRVRAKPYPGTMPNVINVPYGLGHTMPGEWANQRGVNPLLIMEGKSDPISGMAAPGLTPVRIYKA
ncbi:MAG: molybdopterin-dependent oxidoreductase [Acidobacteria bacterium]|nr:molybdopterin-dependent oxidoreductase [Acidobacteriota bacterium]MBI3658840.1 molybdopterin-dependent oxidoreductase [Acidobacteriota bacterium]